MNNEYILNLRNRQIIYEKIQKNPGINITNLIKRTNIPKTTLSYHIRYLLKHELIVERKSSRFARFFVRNKISNSDKELLPFLRNKISCDIIFVILSRAASSRIKISNHLEKDPTTVSYHLKKLIDAGIIEIAPGEKNGVKRVEGGLVYTNTIGREVYYRLKKNVKEQIYNILIAHQDSILNENNKLLLDTMNIVKESGFPKNIFSTEKAIERVINLYFEWCPIPFIA